MELKMYVWKSWVAIAHFLLPNISSFVKLLLSYVAHSLLFPLGDYTSNYFSLKVLFKT